MDRHYQLKVTSDTTNIDVDSIDADEVARIVQLAGLKSTPAPVMQPEVPVSGPSIDEPPVDSSSALLRPPEHGMMEEISCAICGSSDHDEHSCPETIMAENVAEFDYGHDEIDDDGDEVEIDNWRDSKLPQRIVKGGQGDNPLISELHEHLLAEYSKYIAEGDDRENDDGVMSPLSDPTKPEFDKDPFSGDTPVDDGSRSPMSTIKRQPALK